MDDQLDQTTTTPERPEPLPGGDENLRQYAQQLTDAREGESNNRAQVEKDVGERLARHYREPTDQEIEAVSRRRDALRAQAMQSLDEARKADGKAGLNARSAAEMLDYLRRAEYGEFQNAAIEQINEAGQAEMQLAEAQRATEQQLQAEQQHQEQRQEPARQSSEWTPTAAEYAVGKQVIENYKLQLINSVPEIRAPAGLDPQQAAAYEAQAFQQLAARDPQRAMAIQARALQLRQAEMQLEQRDGERRAAERAEFSKYASEQDRLFETKNPDAISTEAAHEAKAMLNHHGFSDEEVARAWHGERISIRDHRVQAIMNDARKYRQALASAQKVQRVPLPPCSAPAARRGRITR